MTPAKNASLTKKDSPVPAWLENTLLCIVLGLTVLRATIIENPHVEQLQTRLFLNSELISLLLSAAVLACIGLWLLVSLPRRQFRWRKTGFGTAIGVFILAGLMVACFASNKRAAVTDMVTLATPMLAGLLLVQLLTSAARIRLALFLILAVGAAATVQCIDQKTDSNEMLIAEYEANPTEFLQKQGVVPDSMEHWMYEHRLYSKDIRGFLMTSNSAATFFLMAVFAGLGLCLQALRKKMPHETLVAFVCCLLVLGIVLFGLFLTRSKGGIGAFVLGLGLFAVLCVFGKSIWKRRRIFGILTLLLIVAAAGFIIHYGTQNERLPGGNSMLVRWQYWVSAAQMARDHALTGVGGGNFPEFYTHYKTAAALETVQNPHNWILSLLSQYGPLGLIAFLAAVLLPLYKAWGRLYADDPLPDSQSTPERSNIWIGVLAAAAVMLLFVRPALVDAEFLYQNADVRAAAYFVLYLIPAGIFIGVFILLRVTSAGDTLRGSRNDRLALALMCGLIAVLVHNLIDFAIFEPGNWSVLWLFIAILAAQTHSTGNTPEKVIAFDPSKRLGLFAGLVILSIVYPATVLLPPLKAHSILKNLNNSTGYLEVRERMDAAVDADTLSPDSAFKAAGFFTHIYQQSQATKDNQLLEDALRFARIAAERNPADFKPRRLMGRIHVMASEGAEDEQKQKHLQAAFDDLQQALRRYPGSGKMHYLLANVAEQLGRNDVALTHYREAVEIEDAYRAQFRIMYPERKTVISRLGDDAYAEAKSKITPPQKDRP